MYLDVRSRLYTFILEWCRREGVEDRGDLVISNYLTHQDIAHLICSTRQTTTQLMNELEEQGILQYSRKEIRIQKAENLRALIANK